MVVVNVTTTRPEQHDPADVPDTGGTQWMNPDPGDPEIRVEAPPDAEMHEVPPDGWPEPEPLPRRGTPDLGYDSAPDPLTMEQANQTSPEKLRMIVDPDDGVPERADEDPLI